MNRAVLLVLDGLPHRCVTERITPTLLRLARDGGIAPSGGRAVMTSATYPNHATLVTGVAPQQHGIIANFVVHDGAIVAAEMVGPATPTVFDLDVETAAVYGDQNLVGVTGARRATTHWPPDGVVPADAVPTSDGYIANVTTVQKLVGVLDSDAQLVVAQLNDPDTAGHRYGPDTEDAADVYHATDRDVATIVDALRPRWDETLLVVVSDHDQIPLTHPDCIDLWSPMRDRGIEVTLIPEGDAAVLLGSDSTAGAWLHDIPHIAGHQAWCDGARLAWTEPGHVFGWGEATLRGIHGGPHTCTQVAIVAGGHPLVKDVAQAVANNPPSATTWAPVLEAAITDSH